MAEITAGGLAAAAQSLTHAGQWARAAELLDSAVPANDTEHAAIAISAAEVCVDRDFWCRTASSEAALARASEAMAGLQAGDHILAWDLDLQRLRHDYFAELLGADGPRFGPEGRDLAVAGDLASRARRLRERAPDGGRAAAVTFYAGLVEDNLRGNGAAGKALFTEALAVAEEAGADLTVSEALRHVGYWTSQDGDAPLAREQWERSTRLRQRAGAVPYVLSQLLLLAGLARDTGDLARARTLAGEVRDWALELGLRSLGSQAAQLAETADR